jgi:peroxiredoxin
MKSWKTVLLLGVALSVSAIVMGYSLANRGVDSASASAATSVPGIGTSIGDTAPDFQLERVDGAPVTLADLHGQPAVIVFWTAWCPVCREEAPHINELAAQFEPRGVRVLGINVKDSQARTEAGIKDFGILYTVLRDADAATARRYKVTGTPTVVFLDKEGVVRYFGNGLPGDYSERLDALIGEKG